MEARARNKGGSTRSYKRGQALAGVKSTKKKNKNTEGKKRKRRGRGVLTSRNSLEKDKKTFFREKIASRSGFVDEVERKETRGRKNCPSTITLGVLP